ncbi:MAG: hypothetical protein IPL26_07005 [Leptospiraceae bacterium]|nr:hypothetical protein [Leptospiraceae bacterium]
MHLIKKMMELKINKSGQTPSKRNFQKLTTIEKILLAASCLDIKPNDEIYRLTLFGIVQTHIENLTEEALQEHYIRAFILQEHRMGIIS